MHYTEDAPPIETTDTIIPNDSIFGYSTIVIVIILFFSISIRLFKDRKKI